MRSFTKPFFMLLLCGVFRPVEGEALPTWNDHQETFFNRECKDNENCSLKKFSIYWEDYAVLVGGTVHYGTRMIAEYETQSVDSLTEYGIVQFMRGCQFWSLQTGDGIARSLLGKWQFNEPIAFRTAQWVIDSIDKDPLYWSTPLPNRHFYYRWSEQQTWQDKLTDDAQSFAAGPPPMPRLFITDHPGTAFFLTNEAKNISLEFKTCIYKINDIPLETTPDNTAFAEPIHCFHWYSSFVFDFGRERFETTSRLDPFCLAS